MVLVNLKPEEPFLAKIYTKGKSLPLKMKFSKLEPQIYVFVGLNFMPNAKNYSYKYYGEKTFFVREEHGTNFKEGCIGFCMVAVEPIETMVGCAFSANSYSTHRHLKRTLPGSKSIEWTPIASHHELADVRLETSDSRPLLPRVKKKRC